MFTDTQVSELLRALGITHVITLPDSTMGRWEPAIAATPGVSLVRVCREGEAWLVAAGLFLGGASPLLMIQCTGFFESGDALRNAVHDWRLPLFGVIGYRSYLNQETLPGDTCLVFTEPLLDAWRLDWRLIRDPSQLGEIANHYRACRSAGRPGAVLLAEGLA